MKLILVLSCVFVVAFNSVTNGEARKDVHRYNRFMWMRDESGQLRFEDLQRPILNPQDVEVVEKDINFYLYTQSNIDDPIHIPLEGFTGDVLDERFDPAKPIWISTHGLSGNYKSSSNQKVKKPLLENHDVNHFVLDYNKPASLFYTYAVASVPQCGELAATFVQKLASKYNLNVGEITVTGQSLGAHVVGAMGAALDGKFGRIVGLDPAWPLFDVNDVSLRLDQTDAMHVQIIHSNSGLKGYLTSIGHADFYPNGNTMNQPGCGDDWLGSCAHERATSYFSESLQRESGFTSVLCESYELFLSGSCDSNRQSYIGRYNLDTTATGDYYLETNENDPFSMD